MARVMVVDDDVTVREVVVTYLRAAGYDVGEAADGESALAELREQRADLIVLDLMLPGIDGLEVCRRIRAKDDDVPVIMLTALGSESDRVIGLERGADDYVTKPFSPRELVLRVDSVLRRAGERSGATGPVTVGDQSTVTVHVRRLREKIEADPTHPVRLATVWGVGYRWEAAA
jgi:DNA-binding response OmpR family regulator